jgi:metal-responsive CopG/Arc/MetJ family transcriptional regulator
MKSISLKIPDPLHARLERISKERGAAKSDVVRDALEAYLAEGKNGKPLSIAELAADLVGSIDGPSDLATNPKYMRGFGK